MAVTLGGRIRELRQKRGLTQEELGDRLLINKSTISQYENDAIDIKCSVLREIADALQVFPGDFFVGEDLNPRVREALDMLNSIKDERLLQAALSPKKVSLILFPY